MGEFPIQMASLDAFEVNKCQGLAHVKEAWL